MKGAATRTAAWQKTCTGGEEFAPSALTLPAATGSDRHGTAAGRLEEAPPVQCAPAICGRCRRLAAGVQHAAIPGEQHCKVRHCCNAPDADPAAEVAAAPQKGSSSHVGAACKAPGAGAAGIRCRGLTARAACPSWQQGQLLWGGEAPDVSAARCRTQKVGSGQEEAGGGAGSDEQPAGSSPVVCRGQGVPAQGRTQARAPCKREVAAEEQPG